MSIKITRLLAITRVILRRIYRLWKRVIWYYSHWCSIL